LSVIISPTDHRYFLLGWIIGKLTAENVPFEEWTSKVLRLAKELSMSEPTREEMRMIAAFLKYVNELYETRHPNE
jgi:hypothetical protein